MEKTKKLTTKKLILIIVTVFVLCTGGLVALLFARDHIKEVASEEEYGYINPDETKAETDEGFTIDGVLDEVQYKNNNWLYLHNQEGGADVDIAMTSYFGEKGMYFVYDVTEGNPIYVNTDRSSYLNSCVEMYLAPSTSTKILSNSVFEIDMLPSGDMTFKKSNGASGYTNVATKGDTMAVLGTTTKGGELNTEECYGYYLELFIPWDYMKYLNMDTKSMKDGYVYVNPAHITSFNYTGTDLNVDRYWYSFAQKHGATFSDVYQYFKFDGDGNIGAVPVTLEGGEHYSIEGDKAVIPGMQAQITIAPEEGYAINSILVNGKEYIKKASYNEDGTIMLTLRGEEDGLKVSAVAEAVTAGNKTLSGTVSAHKYGGGSISGLEASYMGPTGERPLEVDNKGKFVLSDLKQGYYTITIEREGYDKLVRGIYVNRNIDVELTLEYPMFTTESGFSYVLDNQNDGLLKRFGSRGIVLTKDSYNKFSVESNFRYDTKLEEEAEHDHFDQQRSGIRIKFSNEKYWHINILKQYDSYRVAYAKHTGDSSVFNWATVYKLSEEEAKKYESEEGIKLEVQRDGKYAAVYLDDKLIAVEILDDEYAKCTAQIGFETWVANRQIADMKYKITNNTEKNITNVYFKRPTEWDVTGQFDGYVTLPKDHDGDSGWLRFNKKYVNVDVTMTMRDYDNTNTDERMALQFNFGNKRTLCVTVTNDANKSGEHIVQTMGDTVFGWKKLCTLTDEQVEKFRSEDGIDLRVIRQGTVAAIYLDGVHLCDTDLTVDKDGKATGIAADTAADVAIRSYGNLGYKVDVPFVVSEKEVETVAIELKASDKGTPVTDKLLYQPGETVVLSGKGTEGYYCTGLKVNGKDVTLNWDGTYTFKATEKKYTVEGTYAERVFNDSKEWNLLKQNKGVISLPAEQDGDSGWVQLYKKYTDIDFELTLRDYDSSNTDERMAIKFNFGDGKTLCLTVTNDANKSGEHIVQTMDDTIFGWKKLYTLSDAEVASLRSEAGLGFRVVRVGTVVAVYLNDIHVYDVDLTVDKDGNDTGITAGSESTVAVRHYGNVGYAVDMPFALSDEEIETVQIDITDSENGTLVTDRKFYLQGEPVVLSGKGNEGYYCTGMKVNGKDVTLNWDGTYTFTAENMHYTTEGSFDERVFKDNKEWNLLKQNEGVISLPEEHDSDSGWVQFYKDYTDMDLILAVRDYDDSNTDERMAIQFNFGDGKTLCLTVTNDANKSGEHIVQTMDDTIFGWKKLYTLSDAEVEALRSEEGLAFRVVRYGTIAIIYLNEKQVFVADLTVDKDGNPTSVTKDTEATVSIRHYGNVGYAVDIPFEVTEEVVPVDVQIKDSELGTVTAGSEYYFLGDTITLKGSGVAGYYCYGYNVGGKFVEADKNGTFSFEATEDVYEVEALFAKQSFTGWKTDSCWDFTKQYKNIIALNSTCKKTTHATYVGATRAYTDVDFTVKVKDGTNKSVISKTMFILKFNDNNNTKNGRVDLSIQASGDDVFVYLNCAGTGGNDSIVYTLTKEEVQKYKSDGIEMRMVRKGLKIAVYLDGNQCELTNDTYSICQNGVVTLTASTYITETMKTSLVLQNIHDAGAQVEFPYKLDTSVQQVTIEVTNSENGTIVPERGLYVLGDTVVLRSVANDGYYCSEMKVDGKTVEMNWDGTYSLVAEKGSYTVEGIFEKRVFKDSANEFTLWNTLKQNQGSVTLTNGRTGIKGVVSAFTDAATAAGKYTALEFYDSYTDIDLTLTVKNDPNTSKGEMPRTAVEFAFTNNQKVKFSVTEAGGDVYIITMDGLISWKRIYKFTDEQEAKYRSTEGVEWRVVRKGTQFFFSVDGVACVQGSEASASTWYQADIIDLTAITSNTVTASTKATVKLLHYGDAGQWIEMPFTVIGTVNALFTGWKTDNCWKLTKQYIDILSLDGSSCKKTNHATYVGAGKAYTDVDFTVKVKDGTNKSVTSKTLLILKFNDNNTATQGWVGFSIQSSDDDVFIYLKCADTGGNDSVVYTLTAEEAQKYKSDGIEMRMVRKGLKLAVYLDGNQCELTNDTYSICQNGVVTLTSTKYITETMKTSLVLQHLHDAGAQVEFPYKLYTTVDENVFHVSTAKTRVFSLLKKLLLID